MLSLVLTSNPHATKRAGIITAPPATKSGKVPRNGVKPKFWSTKSCIWWSVVLSTVAVRLRLEQKGRKSSKIMQSLPSFTRRSWPFLEKVYQFWQSFQATETLSNIYLQMAKSPMWIWMSSHMRMKKGTLPSTWKTLAIPSFFANGLVTNSVRQHPKKENAVLS